MEKNERNYWLHRISLDREEKQQLLNQHGLLATAWRNLSADFIVGQVRNMDRDAFSQVYQERLNVLPRNRFCLYMFLHDFKKGDYVIVPGDKNFSVYEITGNSPFSFEELAQHYSDIRVTSQDMGFFWEVRKVETDIDREQYAGNKLRRRLKFMMTNVSMTDLADEIEAAIEAKKNGMAINLKSQIASNAGKAILDSLKNAIGDSQFEKVVKWYMESIGATSAFIPSKRNLARDEGDADVIALFDELRIVVYTQVKQYDRCVEKKALEQVFLASKAYSGEYSERTALLWVVSTCDSFSDEAIDYANEKGIRLIGGTEFAGMLLDTGLKDLNV